MNEQEWMTCHEPIRMWAWLQSRRGLLRRFAQWFGTVYWMPRRKELLFATGYCRATRFAWSSEHENVLRAAEEYVDQPRRFNGKLARDCQLAYYLPMIFLDWEHESMQRAAHYNPVMADETLRSFVDQCGLFCNVFRDVFHNDFVATCKNNFNFGTEHEGAISTMAAAIYRDGTFDRLPMLADLIEGSDCDCREDLCAHCRLPGPHVRGCWVLDRLLGKD